ncbi:MAG: hypothetical protein HRU01_21630 [Myxococcales bacterium]|nr:hypothetical protein [Myxococcales bacterium]
MAQVPPEDDSTPYRPPPIGVGSGERQPLGFRAILLGVAVDWASTIASSTVILFMASIVAASRYQTEKQIADFIEKLGNAPDFVLLTSVIGLGCVTFGGYVCAVIAKRDEIRHAVWMGVVSLSVGLIVDGSGSARTAGWHPDWLKFLGHALVVPAAALGGAAAAARRAGATPTEEPPL